MICQDQHSLAFITINILNGEEVADTEVVDDLTEKE